MLANLKELREEANLSREQLAVKMKVSVVTIYNWERGLRMYEKNDRELKRIFKFILRREIKC